MPTITDIKMFKKSGKRECKITLDNNQTLKITEEICRQYGLNDSEKISNDRLREMEMSDNVLRAIIDVQRFVDYRLRTRQELFVRLKSRGLHAVIIDEAIKRFENLGIINDERFARQWVDERLRNRPIGLNLVRVKLKQKGISSEIIDCVLDGQGANNKEEELAYNTLYRQLYRYVTLERDTANRRMVAFLGRRGFTPGIIYNVVHRILDEIQETKN